MPTQKLTPEIIAAAVEGYESQKASIDRKSLNSEPCSPVTASNPPPHRKRPHATAVR